MLNNVPPCNFQGLIVDILLCIWNCRLKAFSKLEVTDTQNCDSFGFFVPFQSQLLKIVIAYEGFSYLLTYRYRNHVNSFNQAGKKRLFFLTGSLGCDSESAMFFQLTFCSIMPHNKTLVLKHRQGESMWFPDPNIKKSKLENHAKWVWFFLSSLLEQSETLKMQSFFFRRWDLVCRPRVPS